MVQTYHFDGCGKLDCICYASTILRFDIFNCSISGGFVHETPHLSVCDEYKKYSETNRVINFGCVGFCNKNMYIYIQPIHSMMNE